MSESKKPTDLFAGLLVSLFLVALVFVVAYIKLVRKSEAVMPETITAPVLSNEEIALVAVDTMYKINLLDGTVLDAKKSSLEDKLVLFLNDTASVVSKDKWFDFDNLLFETGKTTLLPTSMVQLNNLALILKSYSKLNIKIGAYTDNVGVAADNLKLSTERAANVMGELVKMGIEVERLKSEGYGEQWPVAPNETPEGRAKNRRVALRILEL